MRHNLSIYAVLAAALTLALPAMGQARHKRVHSQDADATDPSQASDAAPESIWGVGAAYLPGPAGALDAISVTYRGVPNLDFDGMLLGGAASGTVSTTFGSATGAGSDFGIGAQARYALLHPSQYLSFQLLGRLSYVTGTLTGTAGGASGSLTTDVFGIFLGGGFEGFIPFWSNVSVEVSSGLNLGFEGTSASAGGATASAGGSAFGLGASNVNAFVPFNLAVHYYF